VSFDWRNIRGFGEHDVDLDASAISPEQLRSDFAEFARTSISGFKILPEFKLVVADLQTFLIDLRHWVDQAECGVRRLQTGTRTDGEREVLRSLDSEARPLLARLFERFEESCTRIDSDLRPAHAHYVKRLLHPVVLCAPFMYRSFHKPLGYAGDYEMVNMMMRDPCEGASLFGKAFNVCALNEGMFEDALFGMRACGPALAANKSYFEKKIINWDPEMARLV